MSNPFATPLRFKLSAIHTYRVWLAILYLAALLSIVFLTSLPVLIKILLSLGLLLTFRWQMQGLSQLPRALIQQDAHDWALEDQAGKIIHARLLPEGYVSRWLIILHFRLKNEKALAVVILPYMMEQENFRRLSVYLRISNPSLLTDE